MSSICVFSKSLHCFSSVPQLCLIPFISSKKNELFPCRPMQWQTAAVESPNISWKPFQMQRHICYNLILYFEWWSYSTVAFTSVHSFVFCLCLWSSLQHDFARSKKLQQWNNSDQHKSERVKIITVKKNMLKIKNLCNYLQLLINKVNFTKDVCWGFPREFPSFICLILYKK